jgi:Fe-S-cluster containining protein
MKHNHQDAELCARCGGRCCRNLPGAATPDDFGNDMERVEAALCSGRWTIDWWEGGVEGNDGGFFVRPAIKGHEGERLHPAWEGECTFLTASGCELPHDARPYDCRALEPRGDGEECVIHVRGKVDAALAWGRTLDALVDEDELDVLKDGVFTDALHFMLGGVSGFSLGSLISPPEEE